MAWFAPHQTNRLFLDFWETSGSYLQHLHCAPRREGLNQQKNCCGQKAHGCVTAVTKEAPSPLPALMCPGPSGLEKAAGALSQSAGEERWVRKEKSRTCLKASV